MTNRFILPLLPQLWRTRIHFLPFLHPFARSFATTVRFTDARRLFLDRPSLSPFSQLGAASPSTQCNKPLNNWVRLGQCSLVIATLDSICNTVEIQVMFEIGNYR